jgi:DNA-binding XRE family transcriptional regulator
MSSRVQTLDLAGRKFVVLEEREYERLRALDRTADGAQLPDWPAANSKGNRPALEFLRISIARDIVKERVLLGLTQEQLAAQAGIRQETLCRLETGKQAPNVRTVDKIDQALKRIAQQQASKRRKRKTRRSG